MADETSLMLSWFANYSNFYSVLSVLVGFIIMVVFILRLNGEILLSGTSVTHNPIREQKMVGLQNPFAVHLSKTSVSSLKDGVHLELSFLEPSYTTLVWGVSIRAFQREIQLQSHLISERLIEGKLFDQEYVHLYDVGSLNTGGKVKELYVDCPVGVTEESLGPPPRQTYPLVTVTGVTDTSSLSAPTSVVTQFTVFHLKDSVCRLDSHIVYQFLKTHGNQLLSLQPIFMSTETPVEKTGQSSTSSERVPAGSVRTSVGNTADSHRRRDVTGSECTTNAGCSHGDTMHNITAGQNTDPRDTGAKDCDNVETITVGNLCQGSVATAGTGESQGDSFSEPMCSERDSAEEEDLCVVCQNSGTVYTLLPCRHACVCHACLQQLDRCPICREYIDSFFRLKPVMDSEHLEAVSEQSPDPLHGWAWFNQRLNQLLGLD